MPEEKIYLTKGKYASMSGLVCLDRRYLNSFRYLIETSLLICGAIDIGLRRERVNSSRGCLINLSEPSIAFHTETSHWFCSAKQMVGFRMKRSNGLKLVKIHVTLMTKIF